MKDKSLPEAHFSFVEKEWKILSYPYTISFRLLINMKFTCNKNDAALAQPKLFKRNANDGIPAFIVLAIN